LLLPHCYCTGLFYTYILQVHQLQQAQLLQDRVSMAEEQGKAERRYKNLAEFYPYYKSEHQQTVRCVAAVQQQHSLSATSTAADLPCMPTLPTSLQLLYYALLTTPIVHLAHMM
jgi:hypothetical protein